MARIAFIEITSTVSYGGIQTAVWKLAQTLSALDHEITVFGGNGAVIPPVADARIHVQRFSYTPRERVPNIGSRFQRAVERLSFARHARAAVVAGNFDWVILNKPFDFFWPWIMPKNDRTRFAFISGGTDFIPLDRALVRRVHAILSCSYFNAWQLRTRYRKRYPIVIYNGVDVDQFSPRPDNAGVRARLGISAESTLFAFAGRLVGWKGLSVALRALAAAPMRHLPAQLLIIGDGPDRPALTQLAASLGISQRVIFHDPVTHDQLPDYYAAIDVGVFPSIGDEAFGITIAEAMCCGKPVIASYIGGIPEVVGNEGNCGLLVAPGDVSMLANAMHQLASDSSQRTRMGTAARQRVQAHFSWTASAQRLLSGIEL